MHLRTVDLKARQTPWHRAGAANLLLSLGENTPSRVWMIALAAVLAVLVLACLLGVVQ